MAVDLTNAREFAQIAGEMTGADALEGALRYPSDAGGWLVGDLDFCEYLNRYRNQQVMVIIAPLGQGPAPSYTCGLCGFVYNERGERLRCKMAVEEAARERFIAERVADGCPDLAEALREALADCTDRFASLWAELARGDRDEVGLALALWPDRVVDRCEKDVELAERHDLRSLLWVKDHNGAWRRRKAKSQEIAEKIGCRVSAKGG